MNKASRLILSAVLAAGLALGGTAFTAGAAFADGSPKSNHGSSHHHGHKKGGHDGQQCIVVRIDGRVTVICE